MFFNIATPKFAAQAIRKVDDIGWKPVQILNNVSASVGTVMKPAGLENAQGIIIGGLPEGSDRPAMEERSDMKAWSALMEKYYPGRRHERSRQRLRLRVSRTMVQVLKHCGDDLTRANVMKQAASLKNFEPLLLPGITVNTSPTDFDPIEQLQLMKFAGETWQLFGNVMRGHAEG